jgi:hypothetical protein
MLLAFSFPRIDSLEKDFPVLKSIARLWGRHPNSLHDINNILNSVMSINPLSIIAVIATIAFIIAFLSQRLKVAALVGVLIPFASLLILPSGRAVIQTANHVALTKRPICIGEAVLNGAPWSRDRLNYLPACQAPGKRVIIQSASGGKQDGGQDGQLTGQIESAKWTASVQVAAPTIRWIAITKPGQLGTNVVYFDQSKGLFAMEVSACPENSSQVPDSVLGDKSGKGYVTYIKKFLNPKTIGNILEGANHFAPLGQGRLTIMNKANQPFGYLLPVSGARGDCAVLSGPYHMVAGQYQRITNPSSSDLRLVRSFALDTKVGGLVPVSG